MKPLMKRLIMVQGLVLGLVCLTAAAADSQKPPLIPTPKSVTMQSGSMPLTAKSRIVATDPSLETHANVLSDEILLITGLRLATTTEGEGQAGDIVLKINPDLRADADILAVQNQGVVRVRDYAHTIVIGDKAVVEGWDHRAVCEGTATILHAITRTEAAGYVLPRMKVKDWPFADYTGVMIDMGRQWIPADSIKSVITASRLSKCRYIQLHFTDDQGCSIPSRAFPRLGTQNHSISYGVPCQTYTWEELKDLEAYAVARGVTLVPEIETPGHHGAMARCYPDVFEGPGCMDMAKEQFYKGLDTIIGELCEVFKTTPYFHIGCDEANNGCGAGPVAQVYKRRHAYPYDAQSIRNSYEIYVMHMFRMSKIVRRHGKVPIAWEQFASDTRLKDDIIVMTWYPHAVAQNYQRDGFTTITVPWELGVPFSEWSIFHCNGSRLQRTDKVLGGSRPMWQMSQFSVAEGWYAAPLERTERTWGPDTPMDEKEYRQRLEKQGAVMRKVAMPVQVVAEGGKLEGVYDGLMGRRRFSGTLAIKLTTAFNNLGRIHYTLDWSEPTPQSPVYTRPLRMDKTFVLKAALFNGKQQLGCATRIFYEK